MGTKRKKGGRFIGIPYHVANSGSFGSLRAPEVKLLIDLLTQYHGKNNGCLSPCHALLKKRGWASSSLYRTFTSLVHNGFLVVTRQGWKVRGKATLVAITWNGIDEAIKCEYDDGIIPSPIPLSYWSKDKSTWKHHPTSKPP